jgi:hypothetical protein
VNLIWSAGRFVDLQIIFRADSQKPFCDNVGSGGRRSITSRVSADGGHDVGAPIAGADSESAHAQRRQILHMPLQERTAANLE